MKKKSRYKPGDCLSVRCSDSFFLAVLVTGIYKSYYDLTLLECRTENIPDEIVIKNSRFFGTREGSLENVDYLVDKCMIERQYVDASSDINLICSFAIKPNIGRASYQYLNDIDALSEYYTEELPVREEKTINASRFPEIGFMGKHLIGLSLIIV